MADINAEGLNQIDGSLEGLNDTLNNTSSSLADAIKDGLHEIKEEILKVAVESLPKDFLDLAKQVENIVNYNKIISELSQKADTAADEEKAKERDKEKPGSATGWTPDKLISKVSEKEAAPSLTIIQSMNDLFGDKGTFLETLSSLLSNQSGGSKGSTLDDLFGKNGTFLKDLSHILSTQVVNTKDKSKKKGGDQSEGDLKGPNEALVAQYSKSIKSLDKLFGNVLKVFFHRGKPRFSEEQIEAINKTSKMLLEVNKVFVTIDQSTSAIVSAGLKTIPAVILMPFINLFIDSSIRLLNKFDTLDKDKVTENAKKAIELNNMFKQLAIAEGYAVIGGLLAIPATISALLITLFLLATSLTVDTFDKLFNLPKLKLLEFKTASLINIFTNLAIAETVTIIGGLLAIPALIGVLLITLFLVGVFVLSLLANVLIGTIPQLVLVSVLIVISMAALFLSIVAAVKTIDFLKKSFPKENEDGSTGIGYLDFLLAIVSMIIPLAIFIVAMFVLGLIATIAVLPMIGLTVFSVFAILGLIGIKYVIIILVDTMVAISNLFSGGKESKDDPSPLGAFDGMAVFIGLLKMVLMFIPLILVIAMVALLGIVASVAAPFMLGLKKFNDNAPAAIKGLSTTIAALQEAITGSYNAILGKKGGDGGISQEALSPLEGIAAFFSLILLAISIVPLILVIAMVALLGAVATAASKFMDGLQKFNDTAPGALTGLPKIIEMLGTIKESADVLFAAKNDTTAQKILNAIPGLGDIAAIIGVLGKIAAVAAVIGAIGLIAMAADNVSKYLPAMAKFGDAETVSAFNSFKTGINCVGTIATAADELDKTAKPTSFLAGGIKGAAARLFGGNTSGLASQLGTVVAVLESIAKIADFSSSIQDNLKNLESFGGYKDVFITFKTGVVAIVGELADLVKQATDKTKDIPTNGVKGFFSNIWGGSNNGLTTSLNTIVGIFESLTSLAEQAGNSMNEISSLGDVGTRMSSLMDTFVPGLFQVFRIVGFTIDENGKLTVDNPMLSTEKFWSTLEDILDEIPGVIDELDDITKATKKLNFKVNFHETVIEPIMKLDPAVEKINALKNATKELNTELKKITSENKDAIKTLGNIGKQGFIGSLFGVNTSTSNSANGLEKMFKSDEDGFMEYIAKDVHGIAKHLMQPPASWTDNPIPTS